MESIIIKNGYIVTMDTQRTIFDPGFVEINGELINAVGPMTEAPREERKKIINAEGHIVIPGLINMHQHHWYNLFKGLGDGMTFEGWLDNIFFPISKWITDQDMEYSSYLACLEMLTTGTTCTLNHMVHNTTEETIRRIVEPVVELGMRQVIAKEMRQTPQTSPFSSTETKVQSSRTLEEEIAFTRGIIEKFHRCGEGRIRLALAIEIAAQWLLRGSTTEELILEGKKLADEFGIKISTHIGGGIKEKSVKDYITAKGKNVVEYMQELGVLDSTFILAHCKMLWEREIDVIGGSGASVVANPVSNAYLASGVAPIFQLQQAGANVALGSDGPMVNNSVDMVEQMKFCLLIHNVYHLNPQAFSPERVLEMATINGAKALGLDKEIGSIEKGKKADIALFDLRKPHNAVANKPISTLVFCAKGTDASAVIVNGRILVENFQLVGFQKTREVLQACSDRSREMIKQAGLTQYGEDPWKRRT